MKRHALPISGILLALAISPPRLLADVRVTEPIGAQNMSADKALNSTNGAAFVALGSIVLTEVVSTDFAPGANWKLILTPPTGWRFNAGVGTVTFSGSRDITSASIAVTASNLTVTYSVGGSGKLDTMTIGGLQVQPITGGQVPLAGYILRLSDNPGTAVIAGIANEWTTFGLCNTIPGAPKALAMQTQPGPNSTAGALFDPQPEVITLDQFGNLCDLNTTTVVTAARASGTPALLGTVKQTAIAGLVTFNNLSLNSPDTITIRFTATNMTSVTSEPIVVAPAPADRLVFTVQPSGGTAGSPLAVQPVVRTKDIFGNFSTAGLPDHQEVTLTLTSGSGTLLGTATLDIGTSAGNGTATFTDLRIDGLGTNKQLTASSSGLAGASSSFFSVSAGPFTKLQLLMPGESAAPGTASGKTGLATSQTAGTPFNVTVNAVDAYWNVISTVTDTVSLTSSDSNAALPANAALVSGTKVLSVTLKTVGGAMLTASDLTSPAKTASTSPEIAVAAGAFTKLQLLLPGEVAAPGTATGKSGTPAAQTAGTSFPVTINAVDANWNRLSSISDVVGLTSSDATASLPANTALSGGSTILSVTPRVAGSSTFTARDITDTSKASNTSPAISISANSFVRLQLLVPGETAAPGTASGKTGVPSQQYVGQSFAVTVNAVDANWNKVAATDVVGLTSTDASAALPADTALIAGSQILNVTLSTVGSTTITATDRDDNSKSASTSPAIAVSVALFTAATGGEAISADKTGGAFTPLTGPIYTEVSSGNVGLGTLILKAPAGFVFDTATPVPTVLVAGTGGRSYNINGVVGGTAVAMSSVTSTQLVFTVTKASSGGYACKLTWQNVRVRPAAGTPLASGMLRALGTASAVSLTTNANLGWLRETTGAARKFAIQTQPSATATAGVPFSQQPVLQILDQFGNFLSNDTTTVVTAARNAGSGTLQGTVTRTASAGVVTFTDLSHSVATNITILFSSTGLTNSTSSTIAVSGAAPSTLAFITQPGNATAGSLFATQPVIVVQDAFGNRTSSGLPSNLQVELALTSGTGPLQGAVTANIGTGTATFSNLRIDTAGQNQQLTAAASGLASVTSALFNVNAGAASKLTIETQPSVAVEAGVAFAQQPAIRVEDAFGNLRTGDSSTVVTVARNLGTGTLLGTLTATANAGIARFTNLSYTNVQIIDLRFTSGALPALFSSSINVGPGPVRKLKILTQPSGTATAGVAFAQQPQIRLEDQFGNLCSLDNSSLVTAARGAGTGALQGTTTATANAGVATFTDLNYPIAETMKVLFTSGSASNVLSSNVVVQAGAFTKLRLLVPGESAAPGSATGKAGTPLNQVPDAAFNVTVSAVDANWNIVSNVTHTIAISSSDIFATTTNASLVSGTRQLSVKLSEAATNTFTASDVSDASKAPGTSSAIAALARYTSAVGGSAIPASTAGGAFTSLTGLAYSETAAAQVGKGTIILNAPAGFEFDTAAPVPTVRIDRLTTIGSKAPVNINGVTNGASVSLGGSANQLVLTVNITSANATCKLTWQNIRVRPTASSPLAVGKLTKTGSAAMAGVTNSVSNFGTLREVDSASGQATQGSGQLANTDAPALPAGSSQVSDAGEAANASALGAASNVLMTGISVVGSTVQMTFTGAPGSTYEIQRTSALGNSISWQVVGSVTVDTLGNGVFTDANPPAGQGYYRAKQSP